MFFASCVLHTMLHEHDARYDHSFEPEEFDNADEIDEEGDDEDVPTPPQDAQHWGMGGFVHPWAHGEAQEGVQGGIQRSFKYDHDGMRAALVAHHEYVWTTQRLKWLASSDKPGDISASRLSALMGGVCRMH